MLDPRSLIHFIPKKILVQIQDKAIDYLSEISSDPGWRKLVRSFRSDAQFQSAFEKAIERAVQRFAAEYSDKELVDALTQSTRFWDLPAVQKALKEIVTRPSSYLDKERDALLDSFAEVAPGVEPERVEGAVRFFLHGLAEEVINIPQLFPLYQVQLQKASVEQARQLITAVRELQFDQKQAMTALLEAANQNQLLLAAPGQTPAPTGPKVYHNLPRPDYSSFIGREAEKAKVIERLSPRKQGGVITIDGIGGVGKSALALEVAYYFLDNASALPENERFEAIIWTSAKQTVLTADGIRTRPQVLRNLEDIYTTISITLDREDILRARPEEQATLVMDALSERRTLLIVDNLETVDDEKLLEFLRELPLTAKAIVTTRHRIDVAYPVRLVGLPETDALALIQSECEQKEVILKEDEAKKLFHRTGGIPLAIGWSIGLMGMGYSVESVLARLGSAKNDVIKFSFQSSVETIRGQDTFSVLLALSLFAKDASREALGYVSGFGDDEMSRDDALVTLEKLSLVNKTGNRYSLLPLTKTLANAEFEENLALKNKLGERWCSYFQTTFKSNQISYREMTRFEIEIPNIFGFLDWCWTNNRRLMMANMVLQNQRLLFATGYLTELTYYLELAYNESVSEEENKNLLAFLAYHLAYVNYLTGQSDAALRLFLHALTIFEDIKLHVETIFICRYLVDLYIALGEINSAQKYAEKAHQTANSINESARNLSRIKRFLAQIEIAVGNLDKAGLLLEESIRFYQEGGSEETGTLTLAYSLLGRIKIYRRNFQEAQTELEKALDVVRITKVKSDLAFVLQSFALLRIATDNKREALNYANEGLNLYKQLGMKRQIAESEEIITRIQAMPD